MYDQGYSAAAEFLRRLPPAPTHEGSALLYLRHAAHVQRQVETADFVVSAPVAPALFPAFAGDSQCETGSSHSAAEGIGGLRADSAHVV